MNCVKYIKKNGPLDTLKKILDQEKNLSAWDGRPLGPALGPFLYVS